MQLFVRETYLYKRFFALTGSIALQNLIVFSVNLADNIMLGSFQESSLSGVALVNQIQFLLQMLVMGVGDGMVILASRRWGQKDIQAIGRISSIGMRLAIVLSALIWAVTCFFPRWSLSLFSNDAKNLFHL